MTDHGHDVEFSYLLVQDAADPEGVLETACLADRLGYDQLPPKISPGSRLIPTRIHRPGLGRLNR
jgi:hypothetical protein